MPTGHFALSLLLNQKRVTIILEFDFEHGTLKYKTTRGKGLVGGQVEGFDPPLDFRRLMNEEFVKFFVFDGELADNLLNREHTDAQRAVECLFQIHLFPKMMSVISEYWDSKTKGFTAKDQAGFTRRTKLLDSWESRRKHLNQQREQCSNELRDFSNELDKQKTLYNSEIRKESHRAQRIQTAEREMEKAVVQVRDSALGVLDRIRDPHAITPTFAKSMFSLKLGLDRVKLPESAAKEFFDELANETQCVCGRPIDEQIKDQIKIRAKDYLGSDDFALLNAIKTNLADSLSHSRSSHADSLTNDINQLIALDKRKFSAINNLDLLKQEAEHDPKVMHAKEEIDKLTARINNLNERISEFDAPADNAQLSKIGHVDPNGISSIATATKFVSAHLKKVTEISDTLTLRKKRDLLIRLVDQAYKTARNELAISIRDDANARIAELMPDNPFALTTSIAA